jgi:hypothetical protein
MPKFQVAKCHGLIFSHGRPPGMLPGIGRNRPNDGVSPVGVIGGNPRLAEALRALREVVRPCKQCFNLTSGVRDLP